MNFILCRVNCPFPYKVIDQTNSTICRLEEEYKQICEAASLFEVHVPEPKALKPCRKELRLAKQLWDYIYIVDSSIEGNNCYNFFVFANNNK